MPASSQVHLRPAIMSPAIVEKISFSQYHRAYRKIPIRVEGYSRFLRDLFQTGKYVCISKVCLNNIRVKSCKNIIDYVQKFFGLRKRNTYINIVVFKN